MDGCFHNTGDIMGYFLCVNDICEGVAIFAVSNKSKIFLDPSLGIY